MKSKGCNCKKT